MTTAPTATVAEVARALGVSCSSVYEHVRTGEIPNVGLGRAVRVPRVWLDRRLKENGATSTARIELVDAGTFT